MIVKPNEAMIINGIRYRAGDVVPDKFVEKAPAETTAEKLDREAHLEKFVSTYVINKPKKKDISNV